MKITSYISKSKQAGTVLLGMVVAIILSFGQGGFLAAEETKVPTEQNTTDEEAAEEVLIVQAVNAITTTLQLQVTHFLYFISENILADGSKVDARFFEKISIDGYVNVILRQIISPNAP